MLNFDPIFEPSSCKLLQQIKAAEEKFDAAREQQRLKAVQEAEEARKRHAERAWRLNSNRAKEALEHGCHPKPRDGGIVKFL